MDWKSVLLLVAGKRFMVVIPAEVSTEDYLAQGYVKKQLALFEANPELVEAYRKKLCHLAIEHDDWCSIFKQALCDCDPDVRILGEQPKDVHLN